MSEAHLKESKYMTPQNLVLQREHVKSDEPTGEPESLAGRIKARDMGSLAQRSRPERRERAPIEQLEIEREVMISNDLLYRPKTKENRSIYEKLLAIVYSIMQEQSQDVIKSVVDEILILLKNDYLKDSEKRTEVEALIGRITNEQYSDLVLNVKLITDYNPMNEEVSQVDVPLRFDEEKSESEADEIVSEEEEEQLQNTTIKTTLQEVSSHSTLQIDGYWLQGRLIEIFKDPIQCKELEPQVLNILNLPSANEAENALVSLFTHDHFDFIKLLHSNRHRIYYHTLLGQSQNQQQTDQIQQQMKLSQEGLALLQEIHQSKRMNPNSVVQDIKSESHQITDHDFQSISKKVIDLEQLTFHEAGHFMSNEKCQLPPHSFKVSKKGYEEIYIPAPKPQTQHTTLVQIEELPEFAQPGFRGFKELNVIQSVVYQKALLSNENLLICAPTGAGKTNIALLSMLQVIGEYWKDGVVDLTKFKIIYIAPMKALVSEMVHNFQNRLQPYGIKVAEVTGDSHLSKHQISETQILIATPEKWDILTRKQNEYLSLVKLMIIDEIHLLHDSRGPVLEALVSRSLRQQEQRQELQRIVGLSATLPNYADVAAFIRAKQSGVFFFDNSYRPVPLQQQYIGITEKKAIRKMLLMNEILYEKVSERAGKAQILIFVHSRKETIKTAKLLKEMAFAKDELSKFVKDDSAAKKILEKVVAEEDIRSQDLKELLEKGFAIHHAGLARTDRDLVESLFEKKHIQVLVSTSTLAWGVNLPAHTVIIKGTQIYSPDQGRWVELSPQDILQMMGRAGRPRYDTQGEGIILTSYQELKYYLSLLNMQLPIESQFISALSDQLNAEICMGQLKNLKDAVNWLGYSYLYVRMLRNPTLYQVEEGDKLLIRYRADLVHSAAILLEKHQLITYDRKTGTLEGTVLGKIASNYYIKYPSMAVYNQHLKPNMGMIDILKVFSLSEEFKQLVIRDEEKVELAKLMMSVPVPIKGSPDDATTKVNVLLQSYVSRLKLEGFALNSDMVYVTQSAARIIRAIYEICLKKQWAYSAIQTLAFSKMIEKRMWACMTPLRQFKSLPDDILRRIEKKEGVTWEHLYNMSPQQIGELIRYPRQEMAKVIHKYIHKFPKIEIQAFAQPLTRSCLRIDLQLNCDFQWDEKIHGRQEPFHIFVLDCDAEKILYHEQFVMKAKSLSQQFTLTVPLFEIMHPLYFIRVISDKWLACEAEQPIPFKNLLLPEPFNRCTELLDLTLFALDQFKFPQIENAFAKRLLPSRQFDAIQTQVFQSIYQSTENVFVGSPCFSSKHILPHLAILNIFQTQRGFKSVYVSPIQKNCEVKFNDFVAIFGKSLNLKVGMLTGQVASDSKILESSDIIVSSAQNWDIFSRRWRARKGFRDIRLFIADDLHLIPDAGSILEVITSRMRMIQIEAQFRIIGLSLSIADYKEIADWLGAKHRHTYNFAPTCRPNNVEILITSFDQFSRPQRVQSMLQTVQALLSQQELNIIYVSDRKLARICALELTVQSNLSLTIPELHDQYLQHTLSSGIGFLYECIDENDEKILFQHLNQLSTVVITHKLALHYQLQGHVFVLDNQKYDGLEKRYVDYSIPEMLELVESAREVCQILVYGPKKEYYKKFLFEPLPVESHLNHHLSNHLNAEIVAKNIRNTQDCIDWITWSFMYRRLTLNPNYYNLSEVGGMAINNYLSELIEATIEELQESKCVAIEEDNELESINSGIIANYYYINLGTVRTFTEKITAISKQKELLFILSEAVEFEIVGIRNGEEALLQTLANKVPYTPQVAKLNEPNTKALLLIQSHFSRISLNPDLRSDLSLLELAIRLTNAMVDVASSNLWLRPAIQCMYLCQMLVQALWKDEDSVLLQLPHFTREITNELKSRQIEDLADFLNMEEQDRDAFLSRFTQKQVDEIAQASNRFPTIEITNMASEPNVIQNEMFHVQVELQRQDDVYTDYVIAPHYIKPKEESWWILCADRKTNRLFGNKKVTFKEYSKIDLRFQAPEAGFYELTIYAICDSYVGADQTKSFNLTVDPIIEEYEQ